MPTGRPVLMAFNSFRYGGSQTYALTLEGLLRKQGYATTFVCKPGSLQPVSTQGDRDVIATRWREGTPDDTGGFLRSLIGRASEWRLMHNRLPHLPPPFAIIASQPWPLHFFAVARDRLWPRVPLYGLVHGPLSVEFPPANADVTVPRVDAWFATTQEAFHLVKARVQAPTHLIGNLFRGDDFWGQGPPDLPVARGPSNLLFCGTLTSNKTGPLYALLSALSRLPETCELIIAGDGPERAAVQSAVARLRMSDRVHLVGFVPDVRPYVRAADLVVAAGRAAVEAATCPRPVIIASSEGVHGPLTSESFASALASNFTGRSIVSDEVSPDSVLSSIRAGLELNARELLSVRDRLWRVGDIDPLLHALENVRTGA